MKRKDCKTTEAQQSDISSPTSAPSLLFSYGLHQRRKTLGWQGEVSRTGGSLVRAEEEVSLSLIGTLINSFQLKPQH